MTDPDALRSITPPTNGQREALGESFQDATTEEPETFRDAANGDKVVEIPEDKTDDPIHGLDPAESPGR